MARLRSTDHARVARRSGLAVAVLAAVAGLYVLVPANVAEDAHDGNPCQDADGLAIFVLDLRPPLRPDWTATPGMLLRDVALRLPSATELRVLRLSPRPDSPLAPVARLCVPRGRTPDCRRAWTGRAGRREALYCGHLADVAQQVGELATTAGRPVAGAPLVEALDEVARELDRARGRRSLHVVSDMLQDAPWYSHLEVPPEQWDARAFADRRRTHGRGQLTYRSPVQAEVFYMPRADLSAARPVRDAHQAIWRPHFAALGMAVTFHDQPVMPGVQRHRARPAQLERLARQQDLLEADRLARDAARARLEDARAVLAERRATAKAERDALAAQRRALEGEDAAETRIAADERAASARLEADLAARRPDPAR